MLNIKNMKCNYCEEQLDKISYDYGDSIVRLGSRIEAGHLYVCTSRDCKNCGVVLAIPAEAKE